MSSNEHILSLVTEALNTLDTNQLPLSITIRKCIRIARLRNDYLNLWWLTYETINPTDKEQRTNALREIMPHLTQEQFRYYFKQFSETWMKERDYTALNSNLEAHQEGTILLKTVGEIEIDVAHFDQVLATTNPPQGLHPLDLYHANEEANKVKIYAGIAGKSHRAILERIKQRVYDFLSQTEKQIIFGQLHADIFEQNRQFVDIKLGSLCPDALSKFVAAYRRMQENDPESRAHALTSCRRLLKSLADVLYPASDKPVVGADGKSRILTDEKYITRLWQYIYEQTRRTTSGELLQAQVQDLGNRIDRLYELSNKGVHAEVSQFEVNQSVIQTYIVAGDLLRLTENESAIGLDTSAEA